MTTYDDERFAWTKFYAEVADKLLHYRHNRVPLVIAIAEIARRRRELPFAISDRFADGSTGPLQDIDPFTTMGLFNRSLRDDNREAIATELAQFLGIAEPTLKLSTDNDGIPLLNNQRSWFFHYDRQRQADHIDGLWQMFADAIAFADTTFDPSDFIRSFDAAEAQPLVANNLTMGLYWARPWWYVPLDQNSRRYITNHLGIQLPRTVPSGAAYIELCNRLGSRFEDIDFPVHSFPELSWAAYQPGTRDAVLPGPLITPQPTKHVAVTEYDIDSVIKDGCFLPTAILETILSRLRTKQNIILQGPPGTSKTWLAKRLAYALIGQKGDSKVRSFQFHPNMSYEDFVRGWRPDGKGGLDLADGPFLQLAEDARKDLGSKYVIVIEEINRGNPASTFGELLTLLEADKRNADEALALAYLGNPVSGSTSRPTCTSSAL